MTARAILFVGAVLLTGTAFAGPTPLSEIEVDLVEEAQPVRDVLRRLQAKHGLNYVVSEEVLRGAGSVTVHLKQVGSSPKGWSLSILLISPRANREWFELA